jgi:hypothetical protein
MMDLSSHFPSETHLLTQLGRGALRVWSPNSTSYPELARAVCLLVRGISPW